MTKLIAAINMTLDGFCDHTAMLADEELHQHYTRLLNDAGAIIYGRITYQLMESYWPSIVQNPTGDTSMDEFAAAIDNILKIVFSRTLTKADWKNTELKMGDLRKEVTALKQSGHGGSKDIFVGSPSLIASLTQLHLIDEYQLCVHPVIAGKGLPLFKNISDQIILQLFKTKTFSSGSIVLYYKPTYKDL